MGLKTVKFQIHKRPADGDWVWSDRVSRPNTNIHFIENQFYREPELFYKLLITFPILNELLTLSSVVRTAPSLRVI